MVDKHKAFQRSLLLIFIGLVLSGCQAPTPALIGSASETQNRPGRAYAVYPGLHSGTVSLSNATTTFYDPSMTSDPGKYDIVGRSVALVGDVNGDGDEDYLIGGHNAAYLFYGPLTSTENFSNADATFTGESAIDQAGAAVAAAGDVNADGYADLLIGAPVNTNNGFSATGAAYVIFGGGAGSAPSGTISLGRADVKYTGEQIDQGIGTALAGGGDVNGDGIDDILVGDNAFRYADLDDPDSEIFTSGSVTLIYGPISGGTRSLERAEDAEFVGEGNEDRAGAAIAILNDVDGDGVDDILVGAPGHDTNSFEDAGAAYVVLGGNLSGTRDLGAAADKKFVGVGKKDHAGFAVGGGDFDDDGLADLLIGAPGNDTPPHINQTGSGNKVDAGAAYIVYGGTLGGGTSPLSSARVMIVGAKAGDKAGTSVAGISRSREEDDILIGAVGQDESVAPPSPGIESNNGAVYLLSGAMVQILTYSPNVTIIARLHWLAGVKFTGTGVEAAAGAALDAK